MNSAKSYEEIIDHCQQLLKNSNSTRIINGDDLGEEFQGLEAYESADFNHPELGKIQINATRPEVRPPFEWLYEITVHNDPYMHFLVREKGNIVETYGKNVLPVDDSSAAKLLTWLKEI